MTERKYGKRARGGGARAGETGVALVLVLMATLTLSAITAGLVLVSASDIAIAANFRNATVALHAADAVLARAVADMPTVADWDGLLNGSVRSSLSDGPPVGMRRLPDGSQVDLGQVLNRANCSQPSGCSAAVLSAITLDRPWGANTPVWQLYAFGTIDRLTGAHTSSFYGVVMVADDPAENDDDPRRDGTDPAVNPGSGVIMLRAEVFGPRGVHRAVEAAVCRRGGIRVLFWHTPAP